RTRRMLKVGIVGMGVIGRRVADAGSRGIPGTTLVGGPGRQPPTAAGYPVLALDELIERADLIVEAATQSALREVGPAVLAGGRHLRGPSARGARGAHALDGALAGRAGRGARRVGRAGREARLSHPGAVRRDRGPRRRE